MNPDVEGSRARMTLDCVAKAAEGGEWGRRVAFSARCIEYFPAGAPRPKTVRRRLEGPSGERVSSTRGAALLTPAMDPDLSGHRVGCVRRSRCDHTPTNRHLR